MTLSKKYKSVEPIIQLLLATSTLLYFLDSSFLYCIQLSLIICIPYTFIYAYVVELPSSYSDVKEPQSEDDIDNSNRKLSNTHIELFVSRVAPRILNLSNAILLIYILLVTFAQNNAVSFFGPSLSILITLILIAIVYFKNTLALKNFNYLIIKSSIIQAISTYLYFINFHH